jgi:hypothetical protein
MVVLAAGWGRKGEGLKQFQRQKKVCFSAVDLLTLTLKWLRNN